jgi:hypothetical protein
MYLEFIQNRQELKRTDETKIRSWEHEALALRFSAYVKNYDAHRQQREFDIEFKRLKGLSSGGRVGYSVDQRKVILFKHNIPCEGDSCRMLLVPGAIH